MLPAFQEQLKNIKTVFSQVVSVYFYLPLTRPITGGETRRVRSLYTPTTWGAGPTGVWCVTADGGPSWTATGGRSERDVISTHSL